MPKIVLDKFTGGLTINPRDTDKSKYVEGKGIDPFREYGYLMPGYLPSLMTGTPSIGLIKDICIDNQASDVFFLDQNKIYHISDIILDNWDGNFDGLSHDYYSIGTCVAGYSLAIYKIGSSRKLFYSWNSNTTGFIGMYDLSSTFDDNWNTDQPAGAGAGALSESPILFHEWKSYLWFTNGQYIGKYDGQTGAKGTIDIDAFDLGVGWEASKVISTKNYLCILAFDNTVANQTYGNEQYRGTSKLVFWDGISTAATYQIYVQDNKVVNAINQNGNILIWTFGRDFHSILRQLLDEGSEIITKLRFPVSGVSKDFGSPFENAIDTYGNKLIFGVAREGVSNPYGYIFSYGRESASDNYALTIPFSVGDSLSYVTAIKSARYNKIYVAGYNGSANSLWKIEGTNYMSAYYKAPYTDFGQKVRINYVKYYFKPLASGDSVTPTLDVDYGTSVSLRDPRKNATIAYSTDGAITSKRFNIMKDCHAIAPVLSWSSGGTAFSKIIIDYSFIED
jgi:hypothetical protein